MGNNLFCNGKVQLIEAGFVLLVAEYIDDFFLLPGLGKFLISFKTKSFKAWISTVIVETDWYTVQNICWKKLSKVIEKAFFFFILFLFKFIKEF